MTYGSDIHRLVFGPTTRSAEELAERADRVVGSLRDLTRAEAGLVLRVALEVADRDEDPAPRARPRDSIPPPA